MLRVKNEERFLERCLNSLSFCESIFLFDDHSTDRTAEIAKSRANLRYFASPFEGLNESRDKNFLLREVMQCRPDAVCSLDGDEELSIAARAAILGAVGRLGLRHRPNFTVISLRVIYFWNSFDVIRTDGVYGRFFVPRMFLTLGQPNRNLVFPRGQGPGFHCGSIPGNLIRRDLRIDQPIYHYGYMDQAERLRKYQWYRENDPNNLAEDNYRHMVLGDCFDAALATKHAGPLKLEPYAREGQQQKVAESA